MGKFRIQDFTRNQLFYLIILQIKVNVLQKLITFYLDDAFLNAFILTNHVFFLVDVQQKQIFITNLCNQTSMNKYYSLSPNNKKQFHDFLSPIFDAVRKNKIHSYYQLQNREQNNQNSKILLKKHFIFDPKPKTARHPESNKQMGLPVDNKRSTYNRLYSRNGQNDKKNQTSQSSRTSNNKDTGQIKDSRTADPRMDIFNKTTQFRMFRINQKVKKHLVEQIDFEQIQKMFFKKRQTMTRYEYFLKLKNQPKNLQTKSNKKLSLSGTKKSRDKITNCFLIKDKDQQISLPLKSQQQRDIIRFPVRSPQKRKFWIKQPKRSSKEWLLAEAVISGTSYKTIQN